MLNVRRAARLAIGLCAACAPLASSPQADRPDARPFRISIVDAATGRGVPAVELRTTDQRRFYSDSAGVVALSEPDLVGHTVWLRAQSFGYRALEPETRIVATPGGSSRIELRRDNVAERLYRITGSGLYDQSLRLGDPVPPSHESDPGTPATGMDSAQAVIYRGELFWVWGDTRFSSTPLGNYRSSGATSKLPGSGGLDPAVGIDLAYFRERGRIRPMVADPHPVIWLSALRAATDEDGTERLFATYSKIGAGMQALEHGLVELDDAANVFRIAAVHDDDAPVIPHGHAFRVRESDGSEHLYADLDVRSGADVASVRDLALYEAFTALRPGRKPSDGPSALERDAAGELVWSWKRGTPPIPPETWKAWVESGQVRAREAWYRLIDVESGREITPHHGSLHWNAYRRRWIGVWTELDAPDSFLGEVWYFEGDTPQGPFAYGRKILTHGAPPGPRDDEPTQPERDRTYSFYNPVHHPELDQEDGRRIFFEGTFSAAFTRGATPIPGYDYNQLMYALELDDPRLFLPVAVYRLDESDRLLTNGDIPEAEPRRLAFFAPDRPRRGTVPVRETQGADGRSRLRTGDGAGETRFYCAADAADAPAATWTLYEIRDGSGTISYGTDPPPGARARALCRVWPRVVRFDPFARTARSDPRAAPAPSARSQPRHRASARVAR